VVANFGVLASGLVVLATGWRYADLVVGLAISMYVAKEAVEIWQQASESNEDGSIISGH
jgi:Co/Zn/Cd efflux system component